MMKNNVISVLLAFLLLNLFNSCQGDPEFGLEDQCVVALSFEVLDMPCPEAIATFDLLFIDQDGNSYEFPFELPADASANQLINLPSGNSYGGWVLGDGGLAHTCEGPFFFQINVMNPETGELCADMITSVDGRPDTYVTDDPYISFTLPDVCDGCPDDITVPEDECVESSCGGEYNGSFNGDGYFAYPTEELYICPNKCVRIFGDPVGFPNRYTLKANGVTLDSRWAGDGVTYDSGPWAGTDIPWTYDYLLESQSGIEYTLEVETVVTQSLTDHWSCHLYCTSCDD